MPIPKIKPLLLPVLRIIADQSGHSVKEIRERVKVEFKLTDKQIKQTHPASGINVFVNRVAWALAHLGMGQAITLERDGTYRIAKRGLTLLTEAPSELTIKGLH